MMTPVATCSRSWNDLHVARLFDCTAGLKLGTCPASAVRTLATRASAINHGTTLVRVHSVVKHSYKTRKAVTDSASLASVLDSPFNNLIINTFELA